MSDDLVQSVQVKRLFFVQLRPQESACESQHALCLTTSCGLCREEGEHMYRCASVRTKETKYVEVCLSVPKYVEVCLDCTYFPQQVLALCRRCCQASSQTVFLLTFSYGLF